MRLQESGLPLEARRMVLEVLTGVPLPDDMPRKSCLLYRCLNKATFAEQMPAFDEWGLRLVGLMGPCENPIVVVPLLAAGTKLAPSVDAGGRAPLGADGEGAEMLMPPRAPEASSSGTSDSCPRAAVEEATQPTTPEAGAPETSTGRCEAGPNGSPHLGAPEAAPSSASLVAPRSALHGLRRAPQEEGVPKPRQRHLQAVKTDEVHRR